MHPQRVIPSLDLTYPGSQQELSPSFQMGKGDAAQSCQLLSKVSRGCGCLVPLKCLLPMTNDKFCIEKDKTLIFSYWCILISIITALKWYNE